MCRPIEGNLVRSKEIDHKVRPLKGSSEVLLAKKEVALPKFSKGIAEGSARGFPDHYIIIFEFGPHTLRTRMHHTKIKGVE